MRLTWYSIFWGSLRKKAFVFQARPLRSPLQCFLSSRRTEAANPPGSKSGGRATFIAGSAPGNDAQVALSNLRLRF
eukprot:5342331-Alexandrium_andersonii.AAC.1